MISFKLIIKLSKLNIARDMVPPKNHLNSKLSLKTGTKLNYTTNQVLITPWVKMNSWI